MSAWRDFIVKRRTIRDLDGNEYSFQVPPPWLVELQIWDALQSFLKFEAMNLAEAAESFDSFTLAFSAILNLTPEEIEKRFDSDTLEAAFIEIWEHIKPTDEDLATQTSQKKVPKEDGDSFLSALGMFASECGWTPQQVLELPRIQVHHLSKAVSEYSARQLQMQAAMHGIPVEASSGLHDSSQIDSQESGESYFKELQSMGLPIEVK